MPSEAGGPSTAPRSSERPRGSSILITLIILSPPLPSPDPGRAVGAGRGDRKRWRCGSPPAAWPPQAPHRSPLLTLSAGAAGGGGRGSGIQRPAPRRGGRRGKRDRGAPQRVWGAADLPYSISQPGLGRGVRVYFWAAVPHLAPGGSLAGSGAEQAGGIFILEQHCRGGWLGSCLSRQLLRGPVLAAKAHPEPGEPARGASGLGSTRQGLVPSRRGFGSPLLALRGRG